MSVAAVERTIDLPAVPVSTAAARRVVHDVLAEAGCHHWVEAAELAVSEIVTNAVLHAHAAIRVTVRCHPDELRVEVHDRNPVLPSPRQYGTNATTGRGMALVAAVTRSHGVTPLGADGKVVWFTVSDGPDAEEASVDDLLDAWEAWDAPGAGEPQGTAARGIVLQGLPPTLWLAAAEHQDALLRELALFRAGREQATDDLATADQARWRVRATLDSALHDARERRLARRPLPPNHPGRLDDVPPLVDLQVPVAAGEGSAFAVLQDVLDEAERLAEAGLLLAAPSLPEIVAVRDWVCEQAIAQLAGMPAAAWAGADAERFTSLVDDGASRLDWDPALVRDADRGAVAADAGNRIVAISRPLADALGWRPADLVGRRVVAIVPPHFREAHVAGFTRHLTTGEAHALGVQLELPVLRADGTEIACDFFIERHRTASGRPVYVAWVTPLS